MESINAIEATIAFAKQQNLQCPIIEHVGKVLINKMNPKDAIKSIMSRKINLEIEKLT